jgi:quinol monooxygenase YgiN
MIKVRVKADRVQDLPELFAQLQAAEQPGSGLLRTTTLQDQSDPTSVTMLVVFASEEQARARENDPRRREALTSVQALMAELFDGPPQFTDLTVMLDVSTPAP